MNTSDTIVAPATAPGESAIALIRISGPQAKVLGRGFCRRGSPEVRRMWHGEYRDQSGRLVDEVVFGYFAAPKSYTGEHVLEVSCHGNMIIINRIVSDLCSRGCRLAEPGEFTKQAYLNGRMDLTAAEAVIELIRARDDRAIAAAQRQMQGALGSRISEMSGRLLQLCAGIEAYIDFPEEDLPEYDREYQREQIAGFVSEMNSLIRSRRRGELLRTGVKVVLLGEPNAGKSSIFNRLVGLNRAIVSSEPGTTRDFLEEHVQLRTSSVRLFDTAGLRESAGAIEQMGVGFALERAWDAEILLLVLDSGTPTPLFSEEVQSCLRSRKTLVVLNKCDIYEHQTPDSHHFGHEVLRVSALTGDGFDRLCERLNFIVEEILAEGSDDEGLAVNLRHAIALQKAADAATHAEVLMCDAEPLELVANELRAAISNLGEVVGHVGHEEVLDQLFASFCIGK